MLRVAAAQEREAQSRLWSVRDLVSVDFFTVPTARLRVLFVFVVLAHDRRRVLHFNVTEHPTAAWTTSRSVTCSGSAQGYGRR